MSPIWFRVALSMLAISSASFVIVDRTLWTLQTAPEVPRAMTARLEAPPTAKAAPRRSVTRVPKIGRSLFAEVDDVDPARSQADATLDGAEPVLRGVVIAGGRRLALIASEAGGEGRWIGAGGRIAGAVVEIIQPRRVFLRRGADGFWISLEIVER